MKNIIEFKKERDIPNDLMTFGEVEEKYKIKYHTLYKYTRQICEIPVYTKGGLRVRERDVINWLSDGLIPVRANI